MLATAIRTAIVYSVAAAAPGTQSRQVKWWMSFSRDNSLKLVEQHPKAITGLYTYIGASVASDGAFHCPHNDTVLTDGFAPYWARGLSVTPALGLSNASVMSGAAAKRVAEVAAFAARVNASGLMLDFEPSTSDPAWVRAYAAYVTAFAAAMHAVGLRAEMCVSSWGILDGHTVPEGYGVYAKSGVDTMMSMAG
eukprot:6836285-Prymnesium_polylepis.1